MENLSLFELQGEDFSPSGNGPSQGNLDVVQAEFLQAEKTTWQALFSGYDSLYAITFSSGIGFICKLLEKFKSAEVIFGCEDVISYSLQEVMAFQASLIDRLRVSFGSQQAALIERIGSGSLRLYAARGQLSHEKIYLLSAEDGRKRVIMGSANMSYNAFGGKQRENITYIDGDAAYSWYMERYQNLKESSTDEIGQNAILVADSGEHLDELPISHTVRIRKALVIQPQTEDQKENVQFSLEVKSIAGKLATAVPRPDKKGKLMLSPEAIRTVKRQVSSDREREKELRSEHPQLEIDAEEGIVTLNGQKLDLHPSGSEISHDVQLFLRYIEGYKNFHGDVTGLQQHYYEFANWFFCSPFMGIMRDTAIRYNQNTLPYPVFGLVYGQSKAGKTSFLETLLKMMIGQKVKLSAPDFTRSSIEALKRTVKGAPIIVDDLTNIRFNQHAIETIKNDDFGIADHLVHYPAVVISANEDVKAVAQEIIRRTVICRVEAGLTNTDVMKSNVVRTVQREIGTAFYREYLRAMLVYIPDLLAELRSEDAENPPDILAVSSQVIMQIISIYSSSEIPDYVRVLSLEDYFSERVTGRYAIRAIQTAWRTNRRAFTVSVHTNELWYTAPTPYEIERILKELPETLVPKKSGNCLIMKLDVACEFFEIPFKRKRILDLLSFK